MNYSARAISRIHCYWDAVGYVFNVFSVVELMYFHAGLRNLTNSLSSTSCRSSGKYTFLLFTIDLCNRTSCKHFPFVTSDIPGSNTLAGLIVSIFIYLWHSTSLTRITITHGFAASYSTYSHSFLARGQRELFGMGYLLFSILILSHLIKKELRARRCMVP